LEGQNRQMTNLHFLKNLFSIFLISAIFVAAFGVLNSTLAQSNSSECQSREECEKLLEKYEEEVSQYEKEIATTQQQKKTLQNQISILKKKIEKLNVQIQQSNAMIKDVSLQIKDTEGSIEKTSLKIEDSRGNLAGILKLIYQEDQKSLAEILLSSDQISDFFNNVAALQDLNSKSRQLISDIRNLKVSLEGQKQSLDEEKDDLERIAEIQILQRGESSNTKKEQEKLLQQTKGKESEYQKLLAVSQKKAAEIRARIFELMGVPKAPTFGEALDIAKYVQKITGLRPALVLAVLTQESNIGKNVGQCYLKNPSTGRGVVVSTGREIGRVMNPQKDVPLFFTITQELGRDPYATPVSCPMSIGWGGAMGPAQFIPDTWANPTYGYAQKVKAVTGKAADPWNITDAFLAAGLYLRDLGASQNEFRAVMRYFSGSSWSKWEEFYGRSVLSIAAGYEQDIKELEGS
jgi:peptidoglycan hydrolase CwlO-like protein